MFRPMLAATLEDTWIDKPVLVSPKIDGMRCIIQDGQALSRNLKPIRNERLRELLSNPLLNGLDGELVAGDATHSLAFNNTVRSVAGTKADSENVVFRVFDDSSDPTLPFHARIDQVYHRVATLPKHLPVEVVSHTDAATAEDLASIYQHYLGQGYEGAMIRDPYGPYKFGRSTLKEGYLLKMKPFADAEAIVIGYEEMMRNLNEATESELGYTKRSSAKAGKVPAGILGALLVRDMTTGIEFSIGSGFDLATKELLWAQRESLPGRIVKYRSCVIGVKDAPRFPTFLGFRLEDDM